MAPIDPEFYTYRDEPDDKHESDVFGNCLLALGLCFVLLYILTKIF